jgi:hypothetical protein
VTKQTEVVLGEAFAALLPHLDERQRRLALGAAARVLGYGGVRRVARVARVAESTVARGARELGGEPADRVRAVGAGRKRLRERDPGLVPALLVLVEPDQRGDPESPRGEGGEQVRCLDWSERVSVGQSGQIQRDRR